MRKVYNALKGDTNMKKWQAFILLFVTFGLGFMFGAAGASTGASNEDEYRYFKLFSEVYKIIKDNYVEQINTKEVIYGALGGMMKSLDPFSSFFTPEQYEEFKQDTAGEFGGIGIEIGMEKGRPIVISPIEDTPAYRAGLKADDIIIEINGEDTSNLNLMEVVKRIRGKPGTKIQLTIIRKGSEKPLKFELERALIKIQSVKSTLIDNIGYIKLSQFNENVGKDVEKYANNYVKKGVQGIILDLRNNPGGLLTEAVNVSEVFLNEGKLIVYTKGRSEGTNKYYARRKATVPENIPVVVLINKGSASASEIVAGALKDNKRALIVGEKSFGKASVQNIIPLDDGSAIKLTIAYYYTPSGKLIHKEGISPDINVTLSEEEEEKLQEEIKKRKLNGKTTEVILLPELDPQLRKAIELIKSAKPVKEVAGF